MSPLWICHQSSSSLPRHLGQKHSHSSAMLTSLARLWKAETTVCFDIVNSNTKDRVLCLKLMLGEDFSRSVQFQKDHHIESRPSCFQQQQNNSRHRLRQNQNHYIERSTLTSHDTTHDTRTDQACHHAWCAHAYTSHITISYIIALDTTTPVVLISTQSTHGQCHGNLIWGKKHKNVSNVF